MALDKKAFNEGLIEFIGASPTPFHAVAQIAARLTAAGYQELKEKDEWTLEPNQGYWVTRNDSSIIAFHTGKDLDLGNGIRMVGAHTDSPCLKVKPNPILAGSGCQRLAAEVYGGVLLGPWFDRDLSLAGRVTYKDTNGALKSTLVDFEKPIAHIPSLAIHMDREVNNGRKINRQKELNMLLSVGSESLSFETLLGELVQKQVSEKITVLDHEIYAYDTQPPSIIGLEEDFIVSARLDNLLSCYIGINAFLESDSKSTGSQAKLLVCNDHEEIGSQSACGADGPFLRDVLERLCGSREKITRVLARSMMISADNAHAIHPNFPEKHDGNHGPILNAGPVIKVNANQRYATNSENAALFKELADQAGEPYQIFVSRNDMGCGSTIGSITAGELGVTTIDIGCPQWSMHSIRETAGVDDAFSLSNIFNCFFTYDKPLVVGK